MEEKEPSFPRSKGFIAATKISQLEIFRDNTAVLPHHYYWKFLLVLSITAHTYIVMCNVGFSKGKNLVRVYIFDIFFAIDWILHLLLTFHPQQIGFFYKSRTLCEAIIDLFSLLPLEYVDYRLEVFRALRVYKVAKYFSERRENLSVWNPVFLSFTELGFLVVLYASLGATIMYNLDCLTYPNYPLCIHYIKKSEANYTQNPWATYSVSQFLMMSELSRNRCPSATQYFRYVDKGITFLFALLHVVMVIYLIIPSAIVCFFQVRETYFVLGEYVPYLTSLLQVNHKMHLLPQIVRHYQHVRPAARGVPENLDNLFPLPSSVRNEILLDIHWDLLRHSRLFRFADISVRKNVALIVKSWHLPEDSFVFHEGMFSSRMIYIVNGSVALLNKEGKSLAVLSAGTCLGGVNLFFECPSPFNVKCLTYCELDYIERGEFEKLADVCYGLREQSFSALKERISESRELESIYKLQLKKKLLVPSPIKWMKSRWHVMGKSYIVEYGELSEISFTPSNFDELVFSHRQKIWTCSVCGYVFEVLKPTSQFLIQWHKVSALIIVGTAALLPYYASFTKRTTIDFYIFLFIVVLFYLLELGISGFTAVETKSKLITNPKEIWKMRVTSCTFYFDFFTVLSLISLLYGVHTIAHPLVIFTLLLHTFKMWKLIKYATASRQIDTSYVNEWKILKFVLLILGPIYFWASVFFTLTCTNEECGIVGWATYPENSDLLKSGHVFKHAFIYMVMTITGVGFNEIVIKSKLEFICTLSANFTFLSAIVYIIGDLTSLLTMKNQHITRFKEYREDLLEILKERNVRSSLRTRAVDCLETIGIFSGYRLDAYRDRSAPNLPQRENQEIFKTGIINILKMTSLFQNANYDFLSELASRVGIHILPAGEILVKAGRRSTHLFIVEEGVCESTRRVSRKSFILGKGDIFPLVEVMGHCPTLRSVRSLTTCRIMSIDYYNLKRILSKYKDIETYFETVTRAVFNENVSAAIERELDLIQNSPRFEFTTLQKVPDISWFKLPPTWRPKNKIRRCLSYIFLNYIILPHGQFIIYWETMRLISIVLGANALPYRRTIGLHFFGIFFYSLFLYDAIAYVDIYLRFHHAYHDAKGAFLVTDPTKIRCNYLKTAFGIDVVACFPFDIFFGMFLFERELTTGEGLLYLNRILQIYRLFRVPEILTILKFNVNYLTYMVLYGVVGSIIAGYVTAYIIYTDCKGGPVCKNLNLYFNDTNKDKAALHFVSQNLMWTYTVFQGVGLNGTSIEVGEWRTSLLALGVFGVRLLIVSVYVSMCTEWNIRMAVYQHDFKKLKLFMNETKVNSKVRKAVTAYFEIYWLRAKNIAITRHLQLFHPSLRVDLLFHMFGETLRKCQLLADLGDDAIRAVLQIGVLSFCTKHVHLCRINDIIDRTFIVVKGSILIEGPDHKIIAVHREGTIFGNLEPTTWNRQTVTIVTVDHVSILEFPSLGFFQRLQFFPLFADIIAYHTEYHVDYIPPKPSDLRDLSFKGLSEFESSASESSLNIAKVSEISRCLFTVLHNPSHIAFKLILGMGHFSSVMTYVVVLYQFGELDFNTYTISIIFSADVLHCFVILFKFSAAYVDEKGELVRDRIAIIRRYRSSLEFICDVISVLPLDLIALAFWQLRIASILRVNRCLRLVSVFKALQLNTNVFHSHFSVIRAVFIYLTIAVIMLPLAAILLCIDMYYSSGDDRDRLEWFVDSVAVTSLIFSKVTLDYGLYIPSFILMYFLVGSVITNFLWTLCLVWSCSSLRAQLVALERYSQKAFRVHALINVRDASKPLVEDAWNYMRFLWLERGGDHEPQMVALSPRTMRQALRLCAYGPILKKHSFYRTLHRDFFRHLLEQLQRTMFMPGNVITMAGLADRCTYFVVWGEVEEIDEGEDFRVQRNRLLTGGDVFGIVQGVFPTRSHRFTYRALTRCDVLILKYDSWCHLLDFFPADKEDMYHSANSIYIFTVG